MTLLAVQELSRFAGSSTSTWITLPQLSSFQQTPDCKYIDEGSLR